MATPRGAVESYLDVNPMLCWDQHKWDEYDSAIDSAFHARDIFFTPLANYVAMPNGADTYYTSTELLGRHVNHNAIDTRQRYIDALYVDFRRKALQSRYRYGNKAQVHEFDELNSRYSNGTTAWKLGVLRERLMQGIKDTHEKLTRDAILDYSAFRFLADGTAWSSGTADFSTLSATSTYQVNLSFVDQVRLRLVERSVQWTQEPGDWGNPVPNYPGDVLALTTPNVMYDLWNSEEGTWLQDLRQLQDQRIINGGNAQYRGITFADSWWVTLYNAGEISTQKGVTSPIQWGDGAPDPASGTVDNIYYVGQSSSTVTHYIQCDSITSGDFSVGDRISIHTARTSDWGITNGVDFTDGETYEAIVYEEDADNNRLVLTEPVVQEYTESFTATPQGGNAGVLYAFVTKARHIHPIYVIAARGMVTWAARTGIRLHTPIDNADLPSVERVSWDEYGEMNRWNPYVYDIIFCVASDTLSGRAAVSLR